MIVDSNSTATLKYTDPTYQTLLYVQANIYDVSGASPALVTQIALSLIDNGTYQAKYTFTAGKNYLVQKLVYSTPYTVVDQSYAQDNDDVQCIDLKTSNIDAAISTRASQSSVNSIPINPLLTTDTRLNELDAAISSRAPAATALLNTDYTSARAAKLDELDVASSTIAPSVWDVPIASHLTAGSTGITLSNATGSNSPTVIAAAVWDQVASAHDTNGTFGQVIQTAAQAAAGGNTVLTIQSPSNTVAISEGC